MWYRNVHRSYAYKKLVTIVKVYLYVEYVPLQIKVYNIGLEIYKYIRYRAWRRVHVTRVLTCTLGHVVHMSTYRLTYTMHVCQGQPLL